MRSNHADHREALARIGEGQLFGVVGYLYYVKKTGPESSNCQLASDDAEGSNVDFHIGVGFDADVAALLRARKKVPDAKVLTQQSVIVEMTPHYRFTYAADRWTLENLRAVIGRQVRVVGQLVVDNEHNLGSQNCAMATTSGQRETCWRASVWELHPVTQFLVCGTEKCTESSPDWQELGLAAPPGEGVGGSPR